MRAHYFQHVAFEGLACIEPWLQQFGYEISGTQFFKAAHLPEVAAIDFLVVLGGPMSVNDEHAFAWLSEEKKFIRDMVKAGKPVLGICLGAQLIASAMGARVFPNTAKEIGWFPLEAVRTVNHSAFQFPNETLVFHWHGETFDLPKGAIHLASSQGCENQAFQIDHNVIGLQFHLETTEMSAQAIVENCKDELLEAEFIQSEARILSAPQAWYLSINRLMASVLEYLHTHKDSSLI